MKTFGRARRESVCACESQTDPTLSQALHLLNGNTVHGKIGRGKLVKQWLDEGVLPEEIIERIYLRSLCRLPTSEERDELAAVLAENKNRAGALNDIFWAVLNSREFLFNH